MLKVFTLCHHGARLVIKSNLLLYSMHYAEACNKFVRPIFASLLPGSTFFEEMSQRWPAVGNSVSNLTGPRFEQRRTRYRLLFNQHQLRQQNQISVEALLTLMFFTASSAPQFSE